MANRIKAGKASSSFRVGRAPSASAISRFNTTGMLLTPSLVLLALFLGIPLIVILVSSFQPNVLLQRAAPGFYNYAYLVAQHYYASVLLRTIGSRSWRRS